MSHEVETMWSGQNRKPWWEGMNGQFANITADDGVDWRKALTLAEADWKVEKRPLYALVSSATEDVGGLLPVEWTGPSEDFYGLVRNTDKKLLYVVGGRYHVIQNAETFQWASNLLDVSEGVFVTAWVLRGGRVVGCTLQLPKEVVVGGKRYGERMPTFLNALNWHGGGALEAHISNVRIECMNTCRASQRSAQSVIHIRHTQSATHKLEIARQTLGITYEYTKEFEKAANALLNEPATLKDLNATIEHIWPKPKDDDQLVGKGSTRWTNRQDAIIDVWKNSPNLENVRKTHWGVYNAVTEWSQWGRNIRGVKAHPERLAALRGEDVLFGQAKDISEQAFAFLQERAGIPVSAGR